MLKTTQQFIKDAISRHGNKYDFRLVARSQYTNRI